MSQKKLILISILNITLFTFHSFFKEDEQFNASILEVFFLFYISCLYLRMFVDNRLLGLVRMYMRGCRSLFKLLYWFAFYGRFPWVYVNWLFCELIYIIAFNWTLDVLTFYWIFESFLLLHFLPGESSLIICTLFMEFWRQLIQLILSS